MSSKPVISVKSLSKCYTIFDRPEDRLKQFGRSFLGRISTSFNKKYFKEFWALKDINLEVYPGEALGIIGKNGAGKSTLLQILCGTVHPSSGSIEVNGRVAALLELGSGFNPEFTGRDNVYFKAALLGLTDEEIDKKYDDIVAFADIGEFINQPLTTYSSGMMMRLAFAVIAHVEADIMIIDEALAVGDVAFVQKCMKFLRNFMKENTLIFVTHDTNTITSLCDRAVWIDAGQVQMEGTPKEIAEAYLEHMYEQQQGKTAKNIAPIPIVKKQVVTGDQRLKYINHSQYRNDLQIFEFNPDSESFGAGGAQITSVTFHDNKGEAISWVVGGEEVTLRIEGIAHQDLASVIIGFFIKNHLGQNLFGDNTYLTYANSPLSCRAGECLFAEFNFIMPILPYGDYSINPALADGTQDEHVQHHWYHNALYFKSTSSSVSTGLVGIPMNNISITVERQEACKIA